MFITYKIKICIYVLSTFIIFAVLISFSNEDFQVAASCECTTGQTSDQSCEAYGCPAGTYRYCSCGDEAGSGQCSVVIGTPPINGLWSCYCVEDTARCPIDSGTTTGGGTPGGAIGGGTPGGTCTVSSPAIPTLSIPANGATVHNNDVTFTWSNDGNWGNGCPNTNTYQLWLAQIPAPFFSCSDGGLAWYKATDTTSSTTSVLDLEWGTEYCWAVVRSNGPRTITSAVRRFELNTPPEITGAAIYNETFNCTANTIGRTDQSNATNPLSFRVNVTDTFDEDIAWAGLVLVPTTGSYAENADSVQGDIVVQKAANARTMIAFNVAGTNESWTYNNIGGWYSGPENVGLNTTFGYGRILSSDTSTVNSVAKTADFELQFNDNFPNGTYNVYAGAATVTPDGIAVSAGSTDDNDYYMFKFGTVTIDTQIPQTTISNPSELGSDQFSITWTATDNVGLNDTRTNAYTTSSGAQIRDEGTGSTINLLSSEPSYPTASNAGITTANLSSPVNKTYTDLTPGLGLDYSFKLFARDDACNEFEVTQTRTGISDPWILANGGLVSVAGGVSEISIPNTTLDFSGLDTDIDYSGQAYLSRGTVIAGNNALPSSFISQNNIYTSNYDDQAYSLPDGSVANGWYDYFYEQVSTNGVAGIEVSDGDQSIVTIPNDSSISDAIFNIDPIAPTGSLYSITCPNLRGWACDGNDYTVPLDVELRTQLSGGGAEEVIGTVTADDPAPGIVASICGGESAHEFNFGIPSQYLDSQSRTFSAYAEDYPGGSLSLIGSRTASCSGSRGLDSSIKLENIFEIMAQDSLSFIQNSEQVLANSADNTNQEGNVLGLSDDVNVYSFGDGNGYLSIGRNVTCDVKAVFLINGDLRINPDFINGNEDAGCVFIVSGDVQLQNGSVVSGGIGSTSATYANYDVIEAFIIADGEIRSSVDYTQFNSDKGDGLLIRGGLVANTVDFQRDLRDQANNIQPAMVIEYDPRYRLYFAEQLRSSRFSVRDN